MITAEWLFKNHASHLALVTLLNNEISYESDMESMQKNHDMDIEGLALGRLPLDGLPHTPTYNSATEQIMLKLEDSAVREQSDRQWQLLQYRRYIQMYDTIITILTPKERWFVDKYYIQKHTTVTACNLEGKHIEVVANTTKSKSSTRTLPLVPAFHELLLQKKEEQAICRKLCGNAYCKDYLGYICVNELGERLKPNTLSAGFKRILEENGLRIIRFHDLRHSCASLLLANGVSLKHIQEWLGHSDFSTTANFYAHLDFHSKLSSAEAMQTGLGMSAP